MQPPLLQSSGLTLPLGALGTSLSHSAVSISARKAERNTQPMAPWPQGHCAFLGFSSPPQGFLHCVCAPLTWANKGAGGQATRSLATSYYLPVISNSKPLSGGASSIAFCDESCRLRQLCCHFSRPSRSMLFMQTEKYSQSRWDVWHAFIHGWASHARCELHVYLHVSCHGPCSPVWHPS